MNTKQIKEELRSFKNIHVLPRDRLMKIEKFPTGIVINTDSSSEPGEHWIAVFVGKDKCPIYFDSFGLPPLHKDLISFLDINSNSTWKYNQLTLQHPESSSCGRYCIEFLKSQYYKRSLISFQNQFTSDLARNEKVLNSLRQRHKK